MNASRLEEFRTFYLAGGGSQQSAASYLTYCRVAARECGDIDECFDRLGYDKFLGWISRQSDAALGGKGYARHVRSALRKYAAFRVSGLGPEIGAQPASSFDVPSAGFIDAEHGSGDEVLELLREAQSLGSRYYLATGKPLGVTGEVAEYEAAAKLGLRLSPARTAWFDAVDPTTGARVQIKGRAVDRDTLYRGMCPAIRCGDGFDDVVLVLLNKSDLKAIEIWRAPQSAIAGRIAGLASTKRQANGTLAISQFKSVAVKVWPLNSGLC